MDEELTITEEPPLAPAATGSSPRLGLEPGTMLGEYRIERQIGEGAMGRVFAAVHPVIGKRAAIKVLTREQCADPHAVTRFLDEARVVNQIGHPNIVDIFAFGELPDGRHYFAMELLDGETLGARIRREPLMLGETCSVIRSLARALDAAHAKGIVHRDLKPDNVFLVAVRGEPPVVKLLDFGIAKLSFLDPADERTAIGAMMGTPQYIAPEQARGLRIDGRADIYALGGILFELVTGRPVFFSDNTPEVLMKHLSEPPPRPSQVARVPAELDELIVAMLAKEPEQRPSLDQICEVIDRLRAKPGRHLQVTPPIGVATLSGAITAERPTVGGSRRVLLLAAITLAAAAIAFAIVQSVTKPHRDAARGRPTSSDATKPANDPRTQPTAEQLLQAATGAATAPPKPRPATEAAAGVASPQTATEAAPASQTPTTAPPTPNPATGAAAPPTPNPVAPTPQAASRPAGAPVPQTADRRAVASTPNPAAGATAAPTPATPVRESSAAPARESSPPSESRTQTPPTGRLELMIRGAVKYVVIVDGKSHGKRASILLSPGTHDVEVRADGEAAQRFSVAIEAGKTRTREVAWSHAAPPAAGSADDRALMAPGEAVPRR